MKTKPSIKDCMVESFSLLERDIPVRDPWEYPPEPIKLKVPHYPFYYGVPEKQVPILKNKCSYCGLTVESPYPQHEACIKLQIEVETTALTTDYGGKLITHISMPTKNMG